VAVSFISVMELQFLLHVSRKLQRFVATDFILYICMSWCRDKWVPVTTEWRVLGLHIEEQPAIWRVAANILNKKSLTVDKGWCSSFGVGRGANNSSP